MVGVDPEWLEEDQASKEQCTCGVCLMLMEKPTSGCSEGHEFVEMGTHLGYWVRFHHN